MKSIVYETQPGHIIGDEFDVEIDTKDEYFTVLPLVLEYNAEFNLGEGAKERADEVRVFLEEVHADPTIDPGRNFLITSDEAIYAEAQLDPYASHHKRDMKLRLISAILLPRPLSLGLHRSQTESPAYSKASYEVRHINRSLASIAVRSQME